MTQAQKRSLGDPASGLEAPAVTSSGLSSPHATTPLPFDSHGRSIASLGNWVVINKDGDKAFLTWQGRNMTEPDRIAGDHQWTGGTGQYTGITGNNTVDTVFTTPTGGYSVLRREWKLSW